MTYLSEDINQYAIHVGEWKRSIDILWKDIAEWEVRDRWIKNESLKQAATNNEQESRDDVEQVQGLFDRDDS